MVGSFTAQALGWRWTIWLVVIAVGANACLSGVVFRETYKVKILERKTKRLQQESGNQRLRSKYQDDTDRDRGAHLRSLSRPIRMLVLSPVVMIVSFFTALTHGISYLILTTLTQVMESTYGLGQGAVGLAFLGRAVGNVIGMLVYGLASDRYLEYKKNQGVANPEQRLPLMLLGAFALPLGLFLYGWTSAERIHWIVPLIGTGVVGFSMLLTLLPSQNYLVDAFDIHSASAISAGVILTVVFGALLPLAGPPMYDHLGYGWGNSLLAFISIAFWPPLIAVWKYGEQMRERGKFYAPNSFRES